MGGNGFFRSWEGSYPNLKSIGEWADFEGWKGSAPSLESIGGTAYFRGWKGTAPKLESINKRKFKWKKRWN